MPVLNSNESNPVGYSLSSIIESSVGVISNKSFWRNEGFSYCEKIWGVMLEWEIMLEKIFENLFPHENNISEQYLFHNQCSCSQG